MGEKKKHLFRQVYMVILSLYGLNAVCDFDGFLDDWTILRRFILWHWANQDVRFIIYPPFIHLL